MHYVLHDVCFDKHYNHVHYVLHDVFFDKHYNHVHYVLHDVFFDKHYNHVHYGVCDVSGTCGWPCGGDRRRRCSRYGGDLWWSGDCSG